LSGAFGHWPALLISWFLPAYVTGKLENAVQGGFVLRNGLGNRTAPFIHRASGGGVLWKD